MKITFESRNLTVSVHDETEFIDEQGFVESEAVGGLLVELMERLQIPRIGVVMAQSLLDLIDPVSDHPPGKAELYWTLDTAATEFIAAWDAFDDALTQRAEEIGKEREAESAEAMRATAKAANERFLKGE